MGSRRNPREHRLALTSPCNAFLTMSHNFIEAVLNLIRLLLMLIHLMMSTLTALCFSRAKIGQGDPFSSLLFSFSVSLLLHHLSKLKH